MSYLSHSAKKTQDFAKNLAKKYKDYGGIFALTGGLGAGKTTFAQGFAKGLGIKEKVISPTFILVRHHKIPSSKKVFYHIDLYRLQEADIKYTGIEEILEDINNVVLIEWAEKLTLLPAKTIKINFEKISEKERKISLASI